MTEEQRKKESAVKVLREHYARQRGDVAKIEPRLATYFDDLCTHSTAIEGDENDRHNYYEILGAIKFLRLLRTYEFDHKKVRQVIRLREGVWQNGKHIRGGIHCSGTSGPQVYRWEPFQVFILASVFGFQAWMDTQLTTSDRDTLLPTERLEDGKILDLRRLCTDFTFYAPRKTDKTGLSAFIQVVFFLLEDTNAEIYCCANSADQSKRLYRRTKMMLQQLDDGHRLRTTETVCDWRPSYRNVRDTSIRPLSAGGKTKDGMFAQLCCADEYGSASYVNGKSDMKMLVDVIQSSMGPRREPMTFVTTTAGRVLQGPFLEKLDGLHQLLEKEMEYESGESSPQLATDRTLTLCLEPDVWERSEDVLLTSKMVRRKINPMLGKIVQHQFYDDEIAKARLSGDTAEVVTKLLNVYQSASVMEWINPEEVRKLQVQKRIDDLQPIDGQHWLIFTGLDFSLGDDFYAHGYLCVNPALPAPKRFFADLDSWVSRDSVNHSPLKALFEQWEKQGWLHIVEGSTIPPEVSLQRLDQLIQSGCGIFASFSYDPYASKIPINALKAYIESLGASSDNIVMPCKQTLAAFNSSVDELGYMIKSKEPWIEFSESPLWPFEAGNMVLEEDKRMGNKKPIKRQGSSGKIDNFIALLMGLQAFDLADGRVNENNSP